MPKLFLPDSVAPRQRTASNLWVPKHLRPAVKRIAVVFYFNPTDKRIIVGFPDNFPVPPSFAKAGYQKIVCTSAHELEIWSQKLRDQERRDEEMTDEQREAFEGPIRAWARQELVTAFMNARNAINKDFCRHALEKMDEDERRRKMKKISYMHQEAFEDGK
jgi:hypothetical protein